MAAKFCSEHARYYPVSEGCPMRHRRDAGPPADGRNFTLAAPDPLRLDPDDPASVERLARALWHRALPWDQAPYVEQDNLRLDAISIARAWKETA